MPGKLLDMITIDIQKCDCDNKARNIKKENALDVSKGCILCDCINECNPFIYYSVVECTGGQDEFDILDGSPGMCLKFHRSDGGVIEYVSINITVLDSQTQLPIDSSFFVIQNTEDCAIWQLDFKTGSPQFFTIMEFTRLFLVNNGLPKGKYLLLVDSDDYLYKVIEIDLANPEPITIELDPIPNGKGFFTFNMIQLLTTADLFQLIPGEYLSTQWKEFPIMITVHNITKAIFEQIEVTTAIFVSSLYDAGDEIEVTAIEGFQPLNYGDDISDFTKFFFLENSIIIPDKGYKPIVSLMVDRTKRLCKVVTDPTKF
jgi:hypothetical protein